jgi:hypothetical protein
MQERSSSSSSSGQTRITKSNAPVVDLLLDSGAFSAWLRDTTVPIKDYIAWLHDHKGLLGAYVGLDVIPGQHGRARTTDEVEKAAAASYKNQQIMLDAGLEPIPVFHQGEPWSYLEQYLKDGEPYIGISAFKDVPASVQRKWLDEAFSVLTNDDGKPIVKVHGFAITNQPFLIRYPFFTCDSTTWSLGPGYGHILVPRLQARDMTKFDWPERPIRFVASGVEQMNPGAQTKQTEQLGKMHLAAVTKFLEEEVGITMTDARYDTNARRRAFLVYFMRLAEHCHVTKFKDRHWDLHCPVKLRPFKLGPVKIMFATTFKNKTWAKLMTEVGANTRLVSYWEVRERTDAEFEHFVTHGTCLAGRTISKTTDLRKNWRAEGYRNYRRLRLAQLYTKDEVAT